MPRRRNLRPAPTPATDAEPPRPRMTLIAPGASPEEAAAVVAALERFVHDTTPPPPPLPTRPSRWLRAALREGVSRADRRLGGWGDSRRP